MRKEALIAHYNLDDIDTLNTYKYPNLVAEYVNTGYSYCTIGEWLGFGHHCKEDDPRITGMVFDRYPITATQAFSLSKLFKCRMEYLFADTLMVEGGKPMAYWRHYATNKRLKHDLNLTKLDQKISNRMRDDYKFYLAMTVIADMEMDEILAEEKEKKQA